ncbi:hypothetical protein DH2020_035420 [Rehmannia glutinosa]|uniref:QWRF motif-containing protein n=1 Tax=Rehmannia glutinosa TaxID=99300 RepID=A0ABR0V6H7_REHGL
MEKITQLFVSGRKLNGVCHDYDTMQFVRLENPNRPPLLRSESDNAPPRRPKAREVSSRYLSLSTSSSSSSNSSSSTNKTSFSVTSGRSQSPMLSIRAPIATPKSCVKDRTVSTERRRPTVATASNAERMLMKSVRSLAVSFQGESFSLPVNKVKPPPISAGTPGGVRKGTPERRKAGVTPVRDRTERDRENSRPIDQQHRWPGRSRGQNLGFLTRSFDCSDERGKLNGIGSEFNELRKCRADEKSGNKAVKLESGNFEVKEIDELDSRSILVDHLNSVPESVSPESTAIGNAIQLRDNTSSRKGPSKLIVAKKFQNDSPVSSPREVIPCRGLSPLRPNKALSPSSGALFRGMASPTRTRNGVGNSTNDNNTCSTPSMLSFAADVRRGKLGENRIVDAHELRLLHNRQLQWRLANVRAENALLVQEQAAERSLYNAWVSTSKLRHSVKSKRAELQLLRHNLNLYSILKEQGLHLDNWDLIDRAYCNSLSGVTKALEASTIRLPVVGGARADVQKVQEAISSAVDVMQAIASSICSLLAKVERTNSLVSELSSLSVRERDLLDQIKDFLSTTFIPLQVCSPAMVWLTPIFYGAEGLTVELSSARIWTSPALSRTRMPKFSLSPGQMGTLSPNYLQH